MFHIYLIYIYISKINHIYILDIYETHTHIYIYIIYSNIYIYIDWHILNVGCFAWSCKGTMVFENIMVPDTEVMTSQFIYKFIVTLNT